MVKRVTVKSSLWTFFVIAFILCIAMARLFYVATSDKVDGMNLKKFASMRNEKTKVLHASRGTIYDSNGDVLASSVNSYKLIAYLSDKRTVNPDNPKHVVDKDMTAEKLSSVINLSKEQILERLNKDAYQVEFGSAGKNLTEITKKEIENLNLPGIDFISSTQRYYKMSNFASYIIGYAKADEEGNINGELGIESYFNDELKGLDGSFTYQSDAYGYPLPNVPSVTKEAESGNDIYLTIDSNIQLICENALANLDKEYDFDWALMTVMDAKTGAIISSATNPSFNPNDLNTLDSYLNPLISYTYEPGSTMKTFAWASAIDEGIYNGNDTYLSGSIDVADVTISDFNKVGWGEITFDKGYAYSSNVAATLLSRKLGKQKLYDYYTKFGFGKKTGIELSSEVKGDIDFNYESEVATASFGQGITVTAIEMLQALTSFTNGGVMLKPYIVDKVVDENKNIVYEGKRTEIDTVIKKETATKVLELMYNANYDTFTKMWQPQTVKLLGKTGTAQIPSEKGGYLDGEYDVIFSQTGMFPAEDPKYIIYTAVKRIEGPQKAVASMTTKAVDEIAAYANIIIDENSNDEKIINLIDFKSNKTSEVSESLLQTGFTPIIIGDGEYIINQYPLNNTSIVAGTKVFLITNSNNIIMPDLTDYSLNEVKTITKLLGLKLIVTGSGYVVSQSLMAGELLNKNQELNVTLN